MAQLHKIDRPPIEDITLAPLFEKWLSDLADQLNDLISSLQPVANTLANVTADIGGGGVGPISVAVADMTASSIVTGTIRSSTNAVGIASMIATATGFDVTFTADPGASAIINYIVYLAPKTE